MGNHRILSYASAVALGSVLYGAGFGAAVAILVRSPLPPPSLLQGRVPDPLMDALSLLVVVAGSAAAAGTLRGPFLRRWLTLAFFLYVLNHGVTAMESAHFSRIGGKPYQSSVAEPLGRTSRGKSVSMTITRSALRTSSAEITCGR